MPPIWLLPSEQQLQTSTMFLSNNRNTAMGDITIRIPQQIHVEYTLKSTLLAKRILDLINALIFREDASASQNADTCHSSSHSPDQLRLGDLALQLFGPDGGVELELPPHAPHQPLELEQ